MKIKITVDDIDIRDWSERRISNSRVYVFFNDTTCTIPFCRAVKDMREQVVPKVLKYMGLPAKTSVAWNAYAGCQCGCSPGFIVKDNAGIEAKEVFVDVRIVK